MKKIITFILVTVISLSFTACGGKKEETTTSREPSQSTAPLPSETVSEEENKEDINYDDIPDNMTSEDGKYEIAFVTDVGQLKDKSFNQGTWEGIKRYSYENDKSYKYRNCKKMWT